METRSYFDAPEEYYALSVKVAQIDDYIETIHDTILKWRAALDPRVRDHFHGQIENVTMPNDRLYNQHKGDAEHISSFIKDATKDYEATIAKVEAIATGGATAATIASSVETTSPPPTSEVEKLYLDSNAFAGWLEKLRTLIIDKLKIIGCTDELINKITEGKYPIDKLATETLEKTILDSIEINPDIAKLLEETIGFSIFNEDGTIDLDKLILAEIIAAENLNIDIDLTTGSPFRLQLEKLSEEIKGITKEHPEIRQLIIDKYGIDIFNEDGTIDINKLALIRIIDGQSLTDDFNIMDIIGKYKPETAVTQPTIPTTPATVPQAVVKTETQAKSIETNITTEPAKTTAPENTVTPVSSTILGASVGNITGGSSVSAGSIGASIVDGMSTTGKDIIDAVKMGAARIASGMSQFKIGSSAGVGTNKAAAGIIAAASLAAGGTAAGGGILLHKKVGFLRFTPDDWNALGEEYQRIIEDLMSRVGFSEDEIETFKNSKFKISTAEMREHTKKIEKALDSNPTCNDEILKLYDYSFLDDKGKIMDYLLFITMIIDGKNSIDEYNMYNVMNQSFEDVDEADFIYSGIAMEDYFDESTEEDQLSEQEELKILNDPTSSDYETEEMDDMEGNPVTDKDWLKDIGVVD